jgi:Uma2 family endonuclease
MATLLEDPPLSPPRTLADALHALGDIDASRIRWNPLPGTATVEDAIRLNEEKRTAFVELVDGVLVEKPMGFPEGILAAALIEIIGVFVRAHNLGIVGGPDTMMQLVPKLLRIPDVSFLSWERINGKVPTEAAPVISPDLAIEVLSPENTTEEMNRKCGEYFKSGAKAVWLVCRKTKTVAVYSSAERCETLTENDILTGGTVLPGFSLDVRKLFGELERTQGD